ncbi:YeiH family protein [Hathewaya histolytica]|uniref:YeiH family protein n=1 Tax=Hathewaya histolytica TaxID=1498 RepID=UPI003B67265C
MSCIKKYLVGIFITVILALVSNFLSGLISYKLISAGVFALLLGMALNPVVSKQNILNKGLKFTSSKVLKIAIILMGASLSFSQVVEVGKFSLIVMTFTLITAFAGGYILGKLFNMDWKLSSLISAGTGICGGSAIAAIAPVIEAEDSDIAYAISATFIFDIVMVILFPIMGKYFGMTDLGYGLWAGTAVNDTSSVVAAGYAFSDAAGKFSVIVKLTRTLSIVPVVLIFSYINEKLKRKNDQGEFYLEEKHKNHENQKVNIKKIFPWFIIMFIGLVCIKSAGVIPDTFSKYITSTSKFLMVMSLGAIGLQTNYKKLSKSGFAPMVHGFIISALVVIAAFLVQMFIGQI